MDIFHYLIFSFCCVFIIKHSIYYFAPFFEHLFIVIFIINFFRSSKCSWQFKKEKLIFFQIHFENEVNVRSNVLSKRLMFFKRCSRLIFCLSKYFFFLKIFIASLYNFAALGVRSTYLSFFFNNVLVYFLCNVPCTLFSITCVLS